MRFKLIFVGGNETQAAYEEELERRVAERWDGRVSVEWVFPGWSSNWSRTAERVESAFATSDAIVLSYFIRTNLGRRLRRTCGEAGLAWIPCAGHGRDALFRAVATAVDVVERTR